MPVQSPELWEGVDAAGRGGRRCGRVRGTAALVGGLCASVASAGLGSSQTFFYNGTTGADGSSQPFVVPADVCEISADALGAEGGSGFGSFAARGAGGQATATIPVTPGETLQVNVGGQGLAGLTSAGGAGGFNGGGAGGTSGNAGGGGGGASDVRQGGTTLTHRVVVAGGGGGSSATFADSGFGAGGAGGGSTGADGDPGLGVAGGGGGTETDGGTAGTGSPSGVAGSPGNGGAGGGGGAFTSQAAGGGGGGGRFGGGGGGNDGSFNNGGGGGGGGSGFTPDGTGLTQGGNTGHGGVTISYVVTPGCASSGDDDDDDDDTDPKLPNHGSDCGTTRGHRCRSALHRLNAKRAAPKDGPLRIL